MSETTMLIDFGPLVFGKKLAVLIHRVVLRPGVPFGCNGTEPHTDEPSVKKKSDVLPVMLIPLIVIGSVIPVPVLLITNA